MKQPNLPIALHTQRPSQLEESTVRILSALADLGCNKGLIGVLLEMVDVPTEARRYVEGPVIVHDNAWKADIPDWMFGQTIAERVDVIGRQLQGANLPEIVGPTEIATVMYPATMEAPLLSEWNELYLSAAARAYVRHNRRADTNVKGLLAYDVRPWAEYLDPANHHHDLYRTFASDIRRKVVAAQAGRERQTAKVERKRQAAPVVLADQFDLFVPA